MGNAHALATLDGFIAAVASTPERVQRALPEAAKALDAEIRATIARGQAADGTPLEPTRDGRKPLTGAAKALRTVATSGAILATLSGPEARHNNGWARGGVVRPLLPKALTPKLSKAIGDAITRGVRAGFGGSPWR